MSILSTIKGSFRRLLGVHPLVEVEGKSGSERRSVSRWAGDTEKLLGRELRKPFRISLRDPEGFRVSKSLRRKMGIVHNAEGKEVCGECKFGGREAMVVRGPGGEAEREVVQHETAHAIASQNGLDNPGVIHSPAAWRAKLWGWV